MFGCLNEQLRCDNESEIFRNIFLSFCWFYVYCAHWFFKVTLTAVGIICAPASCFRSLELVSLEI